MQTNQNEVILAGCGLCKQFSGNPVLTGVSIACRRGNVLALVGENGAGKSTLMNILSGGLMPDDGRLEMDGEEIVFSSPHAAKARGVAFVHQELSLMENMTVGENIMLGQEPLTGRRLISQRALHREAERILAEIGYHVPVERIVSELTPAQKQMTEIAKAWAGKPRVMILDEPTSSLNKTESDQLFRFVRRIRDEGVSVVLITHRLEEIPLACDDVMVLKDGEMTAHERVDRITRDEIICRMVGREITNTYPARCKALSADLLLELRDVSLGRELSHISMAVPRGSVIGVGGLEGQGQYELARALFGIRPFTAGEVLVAGQPARIRSPRSAMRHGIAYVPDDRKLEGLVLPLSVGENISMLVLKQLCARGLLNRRKTEACALEGMESLRIRAHSHRQPVASLSGGNQQKIVFTKWLQFKPKLLVLHEPTRGIDVQSKLEIYELIRSLTAQGLSVLIFTSDMLELIGLSDRIYVLYEGAVSGQLCGEDATEEKIMQLSAGLGNAAGGGEVPHV